MGLLDILLGRKTKKEQDREATGEELSQIKLYIDNIADSTLAVDESVRGISVYRYSDQMLTVVKKVYFNADGSRRITRSVLSESGFELYNGNMAVKVNKWLKHLEDVNEYAVKNPKKKFIK